MPYFSVPQVDELNLALHEEAVAATEKALTTLMSKRAGPGKVGAEARPGRGHQEAR